MLVRRHEADGLSHLRADRLLLCEAALPVVEGVLARVPDGAVVPVDLVVEGLDIAQLVEDPLLGVFVLYRVPGGVDELGALGDVLVDPPISRVALTTCRQVSKSRPARDESEHSSLPA